MRTRAGHLGLTLDQYEEARTLPCEICLAEATAQLPNVPYGDKDSRTFYGTVCSSCVSALGKFRHSPVLLRRAVDFLTRQR
ncbi:endonuclease domain-containing protein [Streptomyces sp. NPDC006655]|uniref:endonuclease domain-containing protein n=1 Tax=Streptomyces sp. NPDC006655 TaxID=3156898 RepID=UPI0034533CF9